MEVITTCVPCARAETEGSVLYTTQVNTRMYT